MVKHTENIHSGHRERMREKLLLHGPKVFNTYELLEMLLYHSIRYKDTNPIAKNLMLEFSTIDAVISAKDELLRVDGVGKSSAKMISSLDAFSKLLTEKSDTPVEIFDDYNKTGAYFAEYFKSYGTDATVAVMLLDSGLRKLSLDAVFTGDYGSAAVRAQMFLSRAVKEGASVAIIAHSHPFGPLFPSRSDMATNTLVKDALESAGVLLLEHYVVSGEGYLGFMNNLSTAFAQMKMVQHFLKTKGNVSYVSDFTVEGLKRE